MEVHTRTHGESIRPFTYIVSIDTRMYSRLYVYRKVLSITRICTPTNRYLMIFHGARNGKCTLHSRNHSFSAFPLGALNIRISEDIHSDSIFLDSDSISQLLASPNVIYVYVLRWVLYWNIIVLTAICRQRAENISQMPSSIVICNSFLSWTT